MVHYLLEIFYYYREALAFATEPVFASLANVLGDHTNVPTPVPSELTEYKLFDVEIKHGIIQVLMHTIRIFYLYKKSIGVFLNDKFFIIHYNIQFKKNMWKNMLQVTLDGSIKLQSLKVLDLCLCNSL